MDTHAEQTQKQHTQIQILLWAHGPVTWLNSAWRHPCRGEISHSLFLQTKRLNRLWVRPVLFTEGKIQQLRALRRAWQEAALMKQEIPKTADQRATCIIPRMRIEFVTMIDAVIHSSGKWIIRLSHHLPLHHGLALTHTHYRIFQHPQRWSRLLRTKLYYLMNIILI